MTSKRLTWLVIVALVILVFIMAMGTVREIAAQAPTPIPTPVSTVNPDPQITALRAQNDQLQRDMDRLITLVGVGITVIVTMAALLVAAQFLFSHYVYEHDKKMILDNLRTAASEIMSDHEKRTMEGVRAELEKQRKEFQEGQERIGRLAGDVLVLKSQRTFIEIKLNDLQSESAEAKGWYENAIFYELSTIRLALESSLGLMQLPGSPSSYAEMSIQHLIDLLAKASHIRESTRKDIREVLEKLPERFGPQIATINQRLDDLPIMTS